MRVLHFPPGSVSLHAVVLHPERPSQHMKALLDSPRYAGSITYLEGSPMHDKDLFRSGANSAAAMFVLTNTSSESHEMEDAAAMLNTMAMKRHVFRRTGLDIAAYVQLILPESKRHFAATHSNHMSLSLICTEELKLNLLALSCTCPGASTLIHNLVASERMGSEGSVSARAKKTPWLAEYMMGCQYEIYRTSLSADFSGHTFSEASAVVYEETGCVLFALEVVGKDQSSQILISPPVKTFFAEHSSFHRLVAQSGGTESRTGPLARRVYRASAPL